MNFKKVLNGFLSVSILIGVSSSISTNESRLITLNDSISDSRVMI